MLDTVCTYPLNSELFTQAIHPTESLVAVGLSSGHVATLRLPPIDSTNGADEDDDDDGPPAPKRRRGSDGTDVIDTVWRTHRHKGSCRALSYSLDGRSLYSAGTDGIVKAADAETGKVTGKVAIPPLRAGRDEVDAPTVLHALSPQTLLLATDSGALHLYDLRDPAPSVPSSTKAAFTTTKPAQTHYPHQDYISSLTPLPPSTTSTSGYSKQWLTTGGTTLALTDLRRGVLVKSEDQEELLLSSLYITGLPVKRSSDSSGEKAVVGGADGVLTLWEKGRWDDQEQRITVLKEKETLDCLAVFPDGVGGLGKKVAVGLGDGKVRFVRLGQNQIVGEVVHDEVEGVVGLGFDVGGRMISGGGSTVKVWQEHVAEDEEEVEGEEGEDEDEGVAVDVPKAAVEKGGAGSDEDDGDDDEQDSSEEEAEKKKKRKKRRRGKGPAPQSSFSFAGLD
ncbi:WD repeat-containing protein jip5 [Extremus antarcticus]|uniref:WD repeat-containing protein JIP5 n=1 Tax=Extremus antarcticus TaxID=702011 RepID=A0AAJ0GBF2_9PEZI|nr:WD repeat-containing protein jip5 [Extremus antarcticus]